MERLPEELQLRILEYLETSPPSEVQARHEPSLKLTSREASPLKSVACLSRQWRRITLPVLFRHARIQADQPVRRAWLTCCLRDDRTLKHNELTGKDLLHDELAPESAERPASLGQTRTKSADGLSELEYDSKVWAYRMYHAFRDLIEFIEANRLNKCISSIVLLSDDMGLNPPSPSISRDWRYCASASLWQQALSVIDPQRIAILAPPSELACFSNTYVNTEAAWAFTDMGYHFVEFRQDALTVRHRYNQPQASSELRPFPARFSIADSSVFRLRDWSSISLNEGSFLQAYGTYEYFERGPPSLVRSINLHSDDDLRLASDRPLASVRHFTYTAIFPFANHSLDFLPLLYQLETLDLQLAPDPQSGILDDRGRTGRAELQDCWQELISTYHEIAEMLSTPEMNREDYPHLKTVICRDMRIPALKVDLDHIFTPLCLPVWAEYSDGVFTRIADQAELPVVEMV